MTSAKPQRPPRTPSAQSPPRTSTRAVAQAASARRAAAASGVPAGAASSSPAPTSAHRHSHTPQGEGGQYLLRYYLGESQRGPRKTSFNAKRVRNVVAKIYAALPAPQHFLNFLLLPQLQGSLGFTRADFASVSPGAYDGGCRVK